MYCYSTAVSSPCRSCGSNAAVEGGSEWPFSEVFSFCSILNPKVTTQGIFVELEHMHVANYNFMLKIIAEGTLLLFSRFGATVERLPILLEILTVLPEEVCCFTFAS